MSEMTWWNVYLASLFIFFSFVELVGLAVSVSQAWRGRWNHAIYVMLIVIYAATRLMRME